MQTQRRFGRPVRIHPTVMIKHQICTQIGRELNHLNATVSEAIRVAQNLTLDDSPGRASAFLEVSKLEEQIAALTLCNSLEGRIARRGAVNAALDAKDERRALALAARYANESEEVGQELADIFRVFNSTSKQLASS